MNSTSRFSSLLLTPKAYFASASNVTRVVYTKHRNNNLTTHQITVLTLYRRLLKVERAWPTFNNRATEVDFRDRLIKKTKEEFRKNKGEEDPVKIKKLIEEAKKELAALQNLERNTAAKKYGDRREHIFPAQFNKAVKQLLTDQEKRMKESDEKSGGFFSRLFSRS